MNSVIIPDYGVMLAKTGGALVIRGPKPRLELIYGRTRVLRREDELTIISDYRMMPTESGKRRGVSQDANRDFWPFSPVTPSLAPDVNRRFT